MDDTKGLRGLLAAVVFQAADDYLRDKYRQEAKAFLQSDGFTWLWEALTDGVVGMPRLAEARELVLTGKLAIRRKAYHARWAYN